MAEALVICRFVARKGKEDQLRALVSPYTRQPECRLYELYESDSRGRFCLNETWKSQAALDQHMATPDFKRLEQTGGELVREAFEINMVKRDFGRRRRSMIFAADPKSRTRL
jgi:quinol monooxygenase YgiN